MTIPAGLIEALPKAKSLLDISVEEMAHILPREHAERLLSYMGDSKVRTPVVHNTASDFSAFDTTKDLGYHSGTAAQANDLLQQRARYWVGTDMEGEKIVGQGRNVAPIGGRSLPLWFRAQNPVETADWGMWDPRDVAVDLKQRGVLSERQAMRVREITNNVERGAGGRAGLQEIRRLLKQQGIDAIQYKNTHEGDGHEISNIALDPGQYKFVLGNRGTYDLENPDMAYGGVPLSLLMAHATQPRNDLAPPTPDAMRAAADATRAVPQPVAAPGTPLHPRQLAAGAIEGLANLPMDVAGMLAQTPGVNPVLNAAWQAGGPQVQSAYRKGAESFANMLAHTSSPVTPGDSTARHAAGLAAQFLVPMAGEAAFGHAAEAALPAVANGARDPLVALAGRDPAAVMARLRPTEDLLAQHNAIDWRLPIEQILNPR